MRVGRCLNQGGFGLAFGLPFLASDLAVHKLLAARIIEESQLLQVVLDKIRLASGHYRARVLALEPRRMLSYSKRHT
jgi:hypothetical protein